MPRKGKELTPQLRSRLCELHKTNKWSARQIQKVYPLIPMSTIHSTLLVRQEANREDNISKRRAGRRRKLSEEDQDYIYNLAIQNLHITYQEFLDDSEVENRVSRTTLWRLYNKLGIRKYDV